MRAKRRVRVGEEYSQREMVLGVGLRRFVAVRIRRNRKTFGEAAVPNTDIKRSGFHNDRVRGRGGRQRAAQQRARQRSTRARWKRAVRLAGSSFFDAPPVD